MQWGDAQDRRDARSQTFTIPPVQSGWLLEGAGSFDANGLYLPQALPSYAGVQPFLRLVPSAASDSPRAVNGAWSMALLRWAQRHWVVTDLGGEGRNYDDSRWLYSAQSSDSCPPVEGWEQRAVGTGPPPRLRPLGLCRGFRCTMSIFGALSDKVTELTALLADAEAGDTSLGGIQLALVGQLAALRTAAMQAEGAPGVPLAARLQLTPHDSSAHLGSPGLQRALSRRQQASPRQTMGQGSAAAGSGGGSACMYEFWGSWSWSRAVSHSGAGTDNTSEGIPPSAGESSGDFNGFSTSAVFGATTADCGGPNDASGVGRSGQIQYTVVVGTAALLQQRTRAAL
jgi:hypothetical protein